MAIKQIFISNILECYYKNYQSLPEKDRLFWTLYDRLDGNRALLYGQDNKVIVTYYPINENYLKDFSRLMQWKNIINLYPQKSSQSSCLDCINDLHLNQRLLKIIKENPGVALIPYRSTAEFQQLITYLKKQKLKFTTPEIIPQDKQFIIGYFNTKRGFRHIWHKANSRSLKGINIPEGFITANREEAIEAAWWFKSHDKSFIIKYNNGAQGIGVLMLDQNKFSNDKIKFIQQITELLKDKMWEEPVIIVEEKIKANDKVMNGSPSVDFFIDPNGKVNTIGASQQILSDDKKTFCGVYLYPELLKNKLIEKAFAAGLRIGEELSRFGYRGYYDMDLITGEDGNIYAVESNLRRNGSTHVHESMRVLLGKKYHQKYHILNEDLHLKKNAQLTYEQFLKLFSSILFDPKKSSGIIVVNPDMLRVDVLNIILIGKNRDYVYDLRKEISKKLRNKLP